MIKIFTLYDIQIDKKILSTLTYIAIESGFNFSDNLQFANTMYRLYNYLKEYYNFADGVVINETLKSKINEFKDIYNSLPAPPLEDREEFVGTNIKNSASSSAVKFEGLYGVDFSTPQKLPYRFVPHVVTGSFTIKLDVYRASDNYKRTVNLSGGTMPSGTASIVVKIQGIKDSYYRGFFEYYDSANELIKSVSVNGTTSYKPNDYTTYEINNAYGSSTNIDIYKITEYDFSIDESTVCNIDSSCLITDDKYFAEDVVFNEFPLQKYSIVGKKINNIEQGKIFEFLQDKLGYSLAYDKYNIKFLTVLQANTETGKKYLGLLSTYPLYYTSVGSQEGLWGVDITEVTPVEIYKSSNGYTWVKSTETINGISYNKGVYEVRNSPITLTGYNVCYSNYPIYKSYRDYTTLYELALSMGYIENPIDSVVEHLNDCHVVTLNEVKATNGSLLPLWRLPEEDFTVDMLPPGATFAFGHHRIEDSVKFPLIWKVLDYTDNLNILADRERLPKGAVYVQNAHVIDVLPMMPRAIYTKYNYGDIHLNRWLNSRAAEGEWWTPLDEEDIEPNHENCDGKVYGYSHRAGFLYNFNTVEIGVIKPMSLDGYTDSYFLGTHSSESPDTLKYQYRPKLYRSVPNTVFHDRPYFRKELRNHLDKSILPIEVEQKDTFCCDKNNNDYYWRRNKSSKAGEYNDSSSALSSATYIARSICPATCIDNSVLIKRDCFSKGVFKLDLPIEELIEIQETYPILRNILKEQESFHETQRFTLYNTSSSCELERNLVFSNERGYGTSRLIKEQIAKSFETARKMEAEYITSYPTQRIANYHYTSTYKTRLKTLVNKDIRYPTTRDLIEEFEVVKNFGLKRVKLKNIVEIIKGLKREVIGLVNINAPIGRFIQEDIERYFNTSKKIITHHDFVFPTAKYTQKNITIPYNIQRKITLNHEALFSTEIKTYEVYHNVYPLSRNILVNIEDLKPLVRFLQESTAYEYPTMRYLAEPSILKFPLQRNTLENVRLSFATKRQITKNQVSVNTYYTTRYTQVSIETLHELLRKTLTESNSDSELLRYIVNSVNFLARVERYVLENTDEDYETTRGILEDMAIINDTLRLTLENTNSTSPTEINITESVNIDNQTLRETLYNVEVFYPTKRGISTTLNKYVSKENLMLYTHLLKQEIAGFIEFRINEEFRKRNL